MILLLAIWSEYYSIKSVSYMESENEVQFLQAQLKHHEFLWQQDVLQRKVKEAVLKAEVLHLRSSISDSEKDGQKELTNLRRRVKTTETLLSYLESKARIMALPFLARTSCGIKWQEGIGLVDKRGVPMPQWNKETKPSDLEPTFVKDSKMELKPCEKLNVQETDTEHIGRTAVVVMQVTDAMEVLVKRALIAEAEVDAERKKAKVSQDEVEKKKMQLKDMWARVEDMEKMAVGTKEILKEIQMKLEFMEQESSRQKQRAIENEQELSKVKHDFGVLKSFIDNCLTTRERLATLENRLLDMESNSERLNAHVASLEASKRQKEIEAKTLLSENDRLRDQLDFKEAELAAMCDQIKLLSVQRNRIAPF